MALETGTFIDDLVSTNPVSATDLVRYGAGHLRLLKAALKNSFAGTGGAVMVAGVDAGTVNAIVITPTPALTEYTTRMLVVWHQTISNTGATTINISGLGVVSVVSVANAALASGDLVAGRVYVGIYDGTAVQLEAVTKNYVDQLAFSTALPAQTGNSGKYLTTNGTSASWALVPGQGGTTITGNVTLTVSSSAAMTVTPTTPGLYATLPDATTCTKGVTLFSVYNAGDYDYGIKTSAGTQLGWVRPRTGAVIGLSDSGTAAGVWATYGLEKIGVTASLVDTTIAAGSSPAIKRIALDSNRALFLVGNSSVYAVVYDASTQTWGAPALIRSTIAASAYAGVLCATDRVLVVTNDSTTGMQTVVLSISTNTVTVNSAQKVSTTLAGNWDRYGQFVAVGSSFVLAYSRASTVAALRVFTVSDITPSVSSETIVHSTAATGEGAPSQLFVSGSICRTINYLNTGNYSCKPYTIATTVATVGTEATAATTSGATERKAFLNTAGNIVLVHTNTAVKATIFKLTGTTEAVSTASLNVATASSASYVDYINVSATKTVICVSQNAIIYSNILTDSSGTASAGTAITQTANNNIVAVCAATYSGNYARFAISMASKRGQITLDTSGASPSLYSMQYVDGADTYSFTTLFPRNFSTDTYSATALLAGANLYSSGGTTATQSELVFSANGIAAIPPHLMYKLPYASGGYYDAAGASRSEAWIIEQQTTTGAKISRVEAAE